MKLIQAALSASLLFSCGGQSSNTQSPNANRERKVFVETRVEVLDPITFSEGSTLAKDSHAIIAAIAMTLQGNPDIELVAIIASAESEELSKDRSQAVIEELVRLDVARERLENRPMVSEEPSVDFLIQRRSENKSE